MVMSRLFLILAVVAVLGHTYSVVSSNKQVNAILEGSSHMPALLIYERDLDRLK